VNNFFLAIKGFETPQNSLESVGFWGIATPVTQERDPTTMPRRSHGSVILSNWRNSKNF
jgi:hypothetical protein